MEIFDHVIRVFPGLAIGDLRDTDFGPFGELGSTAQVFVRRPKHDALVSNAHEVERLVKTATGVLRLRNFQVLLQFAQADLTNTLSPQKMEEMCVDGLTFDVVGSAATDRHRVHPRIRGNHVNMSGGDEEVTCWNSNGLEMVVGINALLRDHLNGMVKFGDDWGPGDPRMLRLIRCSVHAEAV